MGELAEITGRLAGVIDARHIPVWMVKPAGVRCGGSNPCRAS